MQNSVQFLLNKSIDTSYGPSPAIWGDCPVAEFLEDPSKGIYFWDDNVRSPVLVTPTITTQANYGNGYKAFGSSGGTILQGSLEGGNGWVFTETDDNEGYSLATMSLPYKLAQGKGDFWFEARLSTGTVTDNDLGIFVGLVEQQTLSATVPIAAAGTLADANFVGFHRLEGDGDQIDTVYKADGVTQVTVKADAISTTANVHTVAGSLAASTFIKLGMRYRSYNNTLYFYINNVLLPDSKTLPSAAGTDFPNDVVMGLCIAGLCGSSNDGITNLAWWRAAQRLVA